TASASAVPGLATASYDRSLQYLRTIAGFGGPHSVPSGISSLERFARAASMIRQTRSGDPIDRAFTILDAVHQPDYTKWSIVYDPVNVTMYFRTAANPTIRSVAIGEFNLDCSTPVRTLDMNAAGSAFS